MFSAKLCSSRRSSGSLVDMEPIMPAVEQRASSKGAGLRVPRKLPPLTSPNAFEQLLTPSTVASCSAPSPRDLRDNSVSKALGKLDLKVSTLIDVLEKGGLLRKDHFLAQVHRCSFAAARTQFPSDWQTSFSDVFQENGVAVGIAAYTGARGMDAFRRSSPTFARACEALLPKKDIIFPSRLYVFGGMGEDGSFLQTAETVDECGTGSIIAGMKEPRCGAAAAALGGFAYLCGGRDADKATNSVERYHPITGVWERMPQMKERRSGAVAAAVGNCLYVAGGNAGTKVLNSAERFDPDRGVWTQLPAMPVRRSGGAGAVLDGQLYICGGFDVRGEALSLACCFNTTAGVWKALPPMITPRRFPAAAVIQGRLYVCGGSAGSGPGATALNSIERYNPVTNMWEEVLPMAECRFRAVASNLGGQLYVAGGYDGQKRLDSVERFDPSRADRWEPERWERLPPMLTPRDSAAMLTLFLG